MQEVVIICSLIDVQHTLNSVFQSYFNFSPEGKSVDIKKSSHKKVSWERSCIWYAATSVGSQVFDVHVHCK